MKKYLLVGVAGLAALVATTPAAAQYYPQPYPNTAQNVIGQIIGNVFGYGQYPYGNYGYNQPNYRASQIAVDQCARAVEARLNGYAVNNQYDSWNPYRNRWSGWAVPGRARVLGIDNVQLRNNGRLRVTGVATSGNMYQRGYGYGGYQYNSQYGTPDLRFTCKAGRSGRVHDVDIDRMSYYGRWR